MDCEDPILKKLLNEGRITEEGLAEARARSEAYEESFTDNETFFDELLK